MNRLKARQMKVIALAAVLTIVVPATVTCGQRGLGDSLGAARLTAKPPVIRLSGKLQEIRNHPCENTTGIADIGTHLILENEKGRRLNIHLGPTPAVAEAVKSLSVGKRLDVLAFRTGQMPANQYVAQTIILGNRFIRLRDANLRPFWSGVGNGLRAIPGGSLTLQPGQDIRTPYRSWGWGGYGRPCCRFNGWGRGNWQGQGLRRRGGGRGFGRGFGRGAGYMRR